MKKTLCLFLSVLVFVMLLTGCKDNKPNGSEDYDLWDGSVADSFDGGNGTSETPYEIASAAQLAFLAEEINSGKDYKGKYFSLLCNLDLNSLEWTPIGNWNYSFQGFFDGNGYCIKNLRVTTGTQYEREHPYAVFKEYVAGLFGFCTDCTIKNLNLDCVDIVVQNTVDRDQIRVGSVAGAVYVDQMFEMSNIRVSNSKITLAIAQENPPTNIYLGGVAGCVWGMLNDSEINIQRLQTDVTISIESSYGHNNYLGGLIGDVTTLNKCDVKDCASYLSVQVDKEDCHNADNYFGAFGSAYRGTSTSGEFITLSNIFSSVVVNKIFDYFHFDIPAYTANAIIGETYHGKQQDGTRTGGYKFENLFGFVKQIDEEIDEVQIEKRLYNMGEAIYTETNCQGCDSLPANCHFDEDVWDLSDLAAPKLK
ncbi:MAG: hypothetical protein IKJ07_00820 [Clostridia bacterium]|nr:hypothetical protein [Clostridia bacterium]